MRGKVPATSLIVGLCVLALAGCQLGSGPTGAGAATGLAPGELAGAGATASASIAPEPSIGATGSGVGR